MNNFGEMNGLKQWAVFLGGAILLTAALFFTLFKAQRSSNETAQQNLEAKLHENAELETYRPKLAEIVRQLASLKQQLDIERRIVPDEKEVDGGGAFAPFGGGGPAAQLVEFSQPLVDAAGDDPKAFDKAFQFGLMFWNLAGAAEAGDDLFVREQLSAMENEILRSGSDVREFRAVVATMFDRYAVMRPSTRTQLERIIAGMQGADPSSAMPELGWAGRLTGAARKILSRKAPDDEKGARE